MNMIKKSIMMGTAMLLLLPFNVAAFSPNGTVLNIDVAKDAYSPTAAVFNQKLYVAFLEFNSSSTYQVRVKSYDGTNWSNADNNGSLNYNNASTYSAYSPKLLAVGNELFGIWEECTSSNLCQVRVKKTSDGVTWGSADLGSPLNIDVTKSAINPALIEYRNEPYVVWAEGPAGGKNVIRIKKWNGSAWNSVDGGTGLNYNLSKDAMIPRLGVYHDELYVFWSESSTGFWYSLRAKKWNGSAWVSADNAAKLNFTASSLSTATDVIEYNDELYVSFLEAGMTSSSLRIIKTSGLGWSKADFNASLASNITDSGLSIYHGKLYAAYSDATVQFKRLTSTAWEKTTATELTYRKDAGEANRPVGIAYKDTYYLFWSEQATNGKYQIRYKTDTFETSMSSIGLVSGSLSINAPMVNAMTPVTLNGSDQIVSLDLSSSLTLSDATGTGSGYRVLVSASVLTSVGGASYSLPPGSIVLKPPTTISPATYAPAVTAGGPSTIDNGAVGILSAAPATGAGSYSVDFPPGALSIITPASIKTDTVTYPSSATPYQTVLTWSIVAGP